jgi:hypothetical protein
LSERGSHIIGMEEGYKDIIRFIDAAYRDPEKQRKDLVLDFTERNQLILDNLSANFPNNNIEYFDFISTYRIVLLDILKLSNIRDEYLQFSYKWFTVFLKHISTKSRFKLKLKTNKVIDYPSDAFTYRCNNDTTVLTSNAYYSVL